MADALFCYGTLCFPEIMRRVAGAVPESESAILVDYACYALVDLAYPGIVMERGAQVGGVLYQGLSRAQFAKLDAYEGAQYRRERVWVTTAPRLRRQVWTYTLQPRYYHRLTKRTWSLEQFRREELARYLHHGHNKLYGLHGRDTVQST
jgi:gamma-glutamylcyclotransferase (GGCT)/AIG2-like uncharacterized protein YtfP